LETATHQGPWVRRGEERRGEERRALEVASRQPHGSRWADFPRKFIAMVKN
jgi:hypothetical protein